MAGIKRDLRNLDDDNKARSPSCVFLCGALGLKTNIAH